MAGAIQTFPGVSVDRKAHTVYVDGRVIASPDMEWIELLACTTGTREHEALIATDAQPSQIHAALLTLGLVPGSPRRIEKLVEKIEPDAPGITHDDTSDNHTKPRYVVHPARGPELSLFFQYLDAATGQMTQTPAHQWLLDQTTGDPIPPLTYLFAGSYLYTHEGQTFFAADTGGTVASLVQFGDDLLATQTDRTSRDGDNAYRTNTAPGRLPAVGTPVRLVIVATPKAGPVAKEPE